MRFHLEKESQMTTNEIFAEALVESFESPKFLRLIAQGTEIDYNESRSSAFDDKTIVDPLRRYKFGMDNYFLSQSRFVDSANKAGLEVKTHRCKNDYPIFVVYAGQFSFTFHHGARPHEISHQSISMVRRQHTTVNAEIVQPNLYSTPDFDLDKLREADNVYANIIHGCGGNGLNFAENGYLQIAVPCLKLADGKESFIFVSEVNLFDILQTLEDRESAKTQAAPMIDIAIPRIRKQI
jgi:hypothetical protein